MSSKKVPFTVIHFGKDGIPVHEESHNLQNVRIDKYGLEAIAREILPDIQAAYEDSEFVAEFEKWLHENKKRPITGCQ